MDVGIVTVGDELLAGDTENSNATWLARQLADRGVTVRRILTVPDEVAVIADTVGRYAVAFDAVIVTGGLGGTPDDVTMAGVAAGFDRELEPNDRARADVERTVAAIEGDYPDLDVDVPAEASLPAGGRALLNRAGLSPGCVVENVYVLPGIPSEMRRMFEDVADAFEGDSRSRVLFTPEPEANLVERLETVRDRFDVAVGCYPDRAAGHNRVKLTAADAEAVTAAADWLDARIESVE